MKFTCNRKIIADILGRIQGLTGRKTNLSITSDILIHAQVTTLSITANDLETVFQGTYDAHVESEGVLSIHSRKFYEIIKEYPENDVLVNEVENRWVEIGTGDSLFHIVSSDFENFPETPAISDILFVEINAASLKKMVDVATVIGSSSEEKRVYVLGALLEKIENEDGQLLRIVSTDSRRLHCFEAPYEGEFVMPDGRVLIPKKGLYELGKFISSGDEPLKIGIKDNHFIVQKENESIMIKLLEGQYPDYQPVLNYSELVPIEMDKTRLSTVLRRVSILTSEEYKSVLFSFYNDELLLTITNPEIGESKEKVAIGYKGEEIKSAFNPRYFVDALSVIDNENIRLYIKDSRSPCIIKPFDDDKLICVIMAMHIS